MQIAVTGGTGFLGRYIIQHALDHGHQVRALTRQPASARKVASHLKLASDLKVANANLQWITGNLPEPEAIEQLLTGADAVVHSAHDAMGGRFLDPPADVLQYWNRNATGSLALLEAAAHSSVQRFIYLSSGAVHETVLGDRPLDESHPRLPSTLYGATKGAVELLIRQYGVSTSLQTATIRPTSIYGAASPIENSKWFDLIQSIRYCGPGDNERRAEGGSKTVHAADVAKATLLLIQSPQLQSGDVYNCCERMISNFEVANRAKKLLGKDCKITGVPKQPKHLMDTRKLQSLGMTYGGEELLNQTIAQIAGISNS